MDEFQLILLEKQEYFKEFLFFWIQQFISGAFHVSVIVCNSNKTNILSEKALRAPFYYTILILNNIFVIFFKTSVAERINKSILNLNTIESTFNPIKCSFKIIIVSTLNYVLNILKVILRLNVLEKYIN